jgi:RimJ/RimL family protein N-acetyltransferase
MVIPYNANYDKDASSFLTWLWNRLRTEGLVEHYFPGEGETGFASLVKLFSGEGTQVAVVTTVTLDGQSDKMAGFITWSTMPLGAKNVAMAGFIFFREFWDHKTTDDAGAAAFEFWFTKTDNEIVVGACPSLNRTAMRYNARIGLKEVGRIPTAHLFSGHECDAVLWCITKQQWQEAQR